MSDRYFETDDQLTNLELSSYLLNNAMQTVFHTITEYLDDANEVDEKLVESLESAYQILKHARAMVRHEEMIWRLTH